MTREEFYQVRKGLGLTRPEAAAVLNITVNTLRIWEGQKDRDGGRTPHPTAVIYLQFIRDNPDVPIPFWPERLCVS